MPPPYAGIPNVSLLYGRTFKQMGNEVAVTFVYRPPNADDLGANAEYFFEYDSQPNKWKKFLFLIKYFCKNPALYATLLKKYLAVCPRLSIEAILYSSYGVFMDGVMEKFKPDVILSQSASIKTFMLSECAQRRQIPVLFNTYAEVHDLRLGVNKHLNEEQRRKYWTYLLNLSDLIIGMDNCSIGPQMYQPKEKVKVFYDTCDFPSYQVKLTETKEQLRTSFGLPQGRVFVGMMGAFHYRKGHDQLIKAIALLKKRGIDVGAVIVGGEVGLEKWQDLAKAEDVEDRVTFFQNFSEEKKIRLYACIDGYANLSNSPRSCGLDLALLEAMACGLPIVVYDNGALPGAVPGQENGYLVKTGDVEGVAEAVGKLAQLTPERRHEMGERSRALAAKTDINLTAAIKLGWFKEVIEARKAKREQRAA